MRVSGYGKEHSNKCFSRKCELTISRSLELTLLRSLQYVSTQKQKVISSAGSHSAFSLGQHYPLPSGPPIWARIPRVAVRRGYNHREVDAQFCHSQNCVSSDGSSSSLGPHCLHCELCYFRWFLTLPGAHTAFTVNWRTQKYCTESLFGLEVLKSSAVPYWKLLWSGVFWNSRSCSFQENE